MIDTEITVGGKCVGKYDLCKDLPMFDLDFEQYISSPSGGIFQYDIVLTSMAQINECYKRNMNLHLLLDMNIPVDNTSYISTVEFKFPRLKDTLVFQSYSDGTEVLGGLSIVNPLKPTEFKPAMLDADADVKAFSQGNVAITSCNFSLRDISSSYYLIDTSNKAFAKVYASIY